MKAGRTRGSKNIAVTPPPAEDTREAQDSTPPPAADEASARKWKKLSDPTAAKTKSPRAKKTPAAIHPALLEVPEKKKSPAERLDELQRAADKAFHLFEESGHMEGSPEWNSALDALREAGITPKGGNYDRGLEGDAQRVARAEWYLGQLLFIAEDLEKGRSPRHFSKILDMAARLPELEAGSDIAAALDARDAARERQRAAFISAGKREGLLQSGYDSDDFRALFGNASVVVEKMLGRRVAVLIEDPKTEEYRELRGKLGPDPQHRYGWFTVDNGREQTLTCFNELSVFFVEDTSPITKKQFSERAKERNDLQAGSDALRELFNGGFSAHAMKGRRMSVLEVDAERSQWRVIEGVLQPDPGVWGDAPYLLDARKMNINHAQGWAIEDLSPISPAEYRERAKEQGMIKVGSPEHAELYDHWFYGKQHDGKKALCLEVDRQNHRYVVSEGVIRPGPHGGFDARWAMETGGKLEEKNINDTKELWVEDTSPVKPADFRKSAKKAGMTQQSSWDLAKLYDRPGAVLRISKEKHEYETLQGTLRKDPESQFAVRFLLETPEGKVPLNVNELKELWAKPL